MERFGIRPVVTAALLVVAAGSGLTVFMTASWQLILCWGVLVGLGTGAMALALVATVTGRWFVARRDRPRDLGVTPYGGTAADDVDPVRTGAGRLAVRALLVAGRTRPFWFLAAGMMICGATTMGLIQPHFIPAAHDHGMPATTAAGLLALVGIFDVAGTIASGWLTDRVDPRWLLLAYYLGRGVSLLALPVLFGPDIQANMIAFIVFYGLDWVATIPPTLALCREFFGASAPVVFGWVFASHQVGAALMALAAGVLRDELGNYDAAWYVGGALCVVAAGLSVLVRRPGRTRTPSI